MKASSDDIVGAGAAMGVISPLGRAAGVSKVQAPSLERAIQCDFELNVEAALRKDGAEASKLVTEALADQVPCHRATLAANIVKWSDASAEVAEMLGFAQAGRILSSEEGSRAARLLLIETADSTFGENAKGSASFESEDGRARRLITPTIVGARKPVPVGIYTAAEEDMQDAGFSKQVFEIARALDRSARKIQADPRFRAPSDRDPVEAGASLPPGSDELPHVYLVPGTSVGSEIPGANALRTLYADPETLRPLVRTDVNSMETARAPSADAPVAARGLFNRMVVEVDEPLREGVEFMSPTSVGNALGWMITNPLYRKLEYKPDAMFYALAQFGTRTLLYRAVGRDAPPQMRTAGNRVTAFELLGFDFADTRRPRGPMLFEAIAYCELICQREMVQAALRSFGRTFAPAWTEVTGEVQRKWAHNARLIEYLAMLYPEAFF